MESGVWGAMMDDDVVVLFFLGLVFAVIVICAGIIAW